MADYRNQIDFIKRWEGGLSRDPDDTGPAANASPCVYNGQTGWHTNKGITYMAFKAGSGYEKSCENFLTMPDDVWLKIFKQDFWDKFYLDSYKSQAIADIVVSWAWGSGLGGSYKQLAKFLNANYGTSFQETTSGYNNENALKIRDKFNELTRRGKEKEIREGLLEQYREFYISLNRPKYINGWLNRLNDLAAFTLKSVGVFKRNWIKFVLYPLGIGAAVVSVVYLVKYINKNR